MKYDGTYRPALAPATTGTHRWMVMDITVSPLWARPIGLGAGQRRPRSIFRPGRGGWDDRAKRTAVTARKHGNHLMSCPPSGSNGGGPDRPIRLGQELRLGCPCDIDGRSPTSLLVGVTSRLAGTRGASAVHPRSRRSSRARLPPFTSGFAVWTGPCSDRRLGQTSLRWRPLGSITRR